MGLGSLEKQQILQLGRPRMAASVCSIDGPSTSATTSPSSNQIAPMIFHTNVPTQKMPRPWSFGFIRAKKQLIYFHGMFGLLGLPMVAIACVSIGWTTLLVIITIWPNETANVIMNTGSFDDGQFWLIVDPVVEIKYLGVAAMVIVDAGYLAVLVKMLTVNPFSPMLTRAKVAAKNNTDNNQVLHNNRWSSVKNGYYRATISWNELTNITGKYRKFWNLLWKVLDLTTQSLQLAQILESGFPASLVRVYSVFLCCNSLSCVFTILSTNHSALAEIHLDSIFDLFAAIIYPIIVLFYSYNNFDFDREAFQLNLDILLPGCFERKARMVADPSEIVLFLNGFDSLRILSIRSLFLRIGMNIAFCYRFNSVIKAQIREYRIKNFQKSPTKLHQSSSRSHLVISKQRRVQKVFAIFFLFFAMAVIVWTEEALEYSSRACTAYPQCVVHAHRWHKAEICPCLTMIDVNEILLNLDEWLHPIDATEIVRALSASGDLQVLQLINFDLPIWPEELRRCKNLRYVSLLYTGLEELPIWAKDFHQLQYLHLEGKEMFHNLRYMDPNLFSNMPSLIFLHIGVNDELLELPPFDGVPQLRSLVLAHMYSIKRIPSLSNLHMLQRLELPYLPALETLPDMTALTNLVHFASARAAHFCCDGFLSSCNLSDPFCMPNSVINISQATCLDDGLKITGGTRAVLTRFPGNYCVRDNEFDRQNASDLINPEIVGVCGGILFKQCEYPVGSGQIGICFNNRMQILMCVVNPRYIALRRAQIARNLGLPCNPKVEQWLGCSA